MPFRYINEKLVPFRYINEKLVPFRYINEKLVPFRHINEKLGKLLFLLPAGPARPRLCLAHIDRQTLNVLMIVSIYRTLIMPIQYIIFVLKGLLTLKTVNRP